MLTLPIAIAGILALLLYLAAAFFRAWMRQFAAQVPMALRVVGPAVLCVPYALVSVAAGNFRWYWLALYAVLPVAIAVLMAQARSADRKRGLQQRGNWRDWLVLLSGGAGGGLALV